MWICQNAIRLKVCYLVSFLLQVDVIGSSVNDFRRGYLQLEDCL